MSLLSIQPSYTRKCWKKITQKHLLVINVFFLCAENGKTKNHKEVELNTSQIVKSIVMVIKSKHFLNIE